MNTENKRADILSFKSAIAGALLSLMVVLPVGYKYVQYQTSTQSINQKIVVMDFVKTVADLSPDLTDTEHVAKATNAVGQTVKKLSDAGFIVLDSKAVLNAPSSMYITDQSITLLAKE